MPKAVLFEYELDEDNLRMLRILQQREGLTSLRAALRECLGIVTTLVRESQEGYSVMLSKDGQLKGSDIDSLLPHPELDKIADQEELNKTVAVEISNELEARHGYSYERALELGRPIGRYKKCPVPDGEWIGQLDFKIAHEPGVDFNARMWCFFTFIREVKHDGKHRGRPGEKYQLLAWKTDGVSFKPTDGGIDMGALEVEPSVRLLLRTRTAPKTAGRYAPREEWGYWNTVDYEDSARPQADISNPNIITAPDTTPDADDTSAADPVGTLNISGQDLNENRQSSTSECEDVPPELSPEEWVKLNDPCAVMTPEIAAIETKRVRRALYEITSAEGLDKT